MQAKNLYFDGLIFSNVYKALDEKVQKIYAS